MSSFLKQQDQEFTKNGNQNSTSDQNIIDVIPPATDFFHDFYGGSKLKSTNNSPNKATTHSNTSALGAFSSAVTYVSQLTRVKKSIGSDKSPTISPSKTPLSENQNVDADNSNQNDAYDNTKPSYIAVEELPDYLLHSATMIIKRIRDLEACVRLADADISILKLQVEDRDRLATSNLSNETLIAKLRTDKSWLESQIQEITSLSAVEIQEYKNSLLYASKENEALVQRSNLQASRINELENEMKGVKSNVSPLQSRIAELEGLLQFSKQQIPQSELYIIDLEGQLKISKENISLLQDRLLVLETEREEYRKKSDVNDNEIVDLRKEIVELNNTISSLSIHNKESELLLEKSTTEQTNNMNLISELKHKTHDESSMITVLKTELNESQRHLAISKEELATLRENYAKLEKEKFDYEGMMDEIEAELNVSRTQKISITRDHVILKQETDKRISDLELKLRKSNQECSEFRLQLLKLKGNHEESSNSAESIIASEKLQTTEKESRITILEDEIELLRSENKQYEKTMKQYEMRMQEYQTNNVKLINSSIKTPLADYEGKVASSVDTNDNNKSSLKIPSDIVKVSRQADLKQVNDWLSEIANDKSIQQDLMRPKVQQALDMWSGKNLNLSSNDIESIQWDEGVMRIYPKFKEFEKVCSMVHIKFPIDHILASKTELSMEAVSQIL